ncbi:uncharacterized protein LTR77_000592 [Saxophila tyrrhenica]|uniref:Delta(24)-sterol reductase n=1 Tax=Saxophila tyrrhenica TaxID=1690608 RepID=A0AAV9PSY4_9PEZI|nr:hypothetical protein LTR77_000592 [Saxophila tyrrhenica]
MRHRRTPTYAFLALSRQQHRAEVERISLAVRNFHKTQQRFRIYHGSTSSTRRPVDGTSTNTIDTSALNNILEIDGVNKVAVVEANAPMDALLEATLDLNLMPLVVTEFPGITVGGAFSGTAGESSSFKHSFFDQTVSKIEMVMADGEVVNCSEAKNKEVFRGAPGALGTLGVVTLLYVRLQPAAKWVEVTYHPFESVEGALRMFRRFWKDEGVDYLDGVMFSPTKGAVVTGQLCDVKPEGLPVQRFSRAKDPWYYMHVEECISSGGSEPHRELVPLPDYLFRYNRGCFWCGKSMFDLTGLPFTKGTPQWLEFMLRTRMLYKALHAQDPNTLMVILDLALPFSAAEEFVNWQAERLDIWPLWLCPLRIGAMSTLHPHPLRTEDKEDEMMLNVGLYGVSPRDYEEWVSANLDLESKVTELGGMKWAYAAQLYSRDMFWQQYDKKWYDNSREKCHATSLPDVYEKTSVDYEAGRKMTKESKEYWDGTMFPAIAQLRQSLWLVREALKSKAWRLERRDVWKDWPEKR